MIVTEEVGLTTGAPGGVVEDEVEWVVVMTGIGVEATTRAVVATVEEGADLRFECRILCLVF